MPGSFSPIEIDKQMAESLPQHKTDKYGFRVIVAPCLSGREREILEEVDRQFDDFAGCFGIREQAIATQTPIMVVEGTFRCKYHGGRCNGEYDKERGLIIASYRAFSRRGILPLLKHEWAHLYEILRSNHSNLDEVRKCTTY